MSSIVVMIKPASSLCNLRCKYCFYLDTAKNREVDSHGFMNEQTLENVVKKSFEFATQNVSFIFQGGEPTLVGLKFYEKFIEYQNKYKKENIVVSNSIQTNGINIDENFSKFFKQNNFLVGVSLDGQKQYHDNFRKHSDEKGSFNEVMQGIKFLKKYNVDFNVLCVVNRITSKNIKQVYEFYKKNKFEYLQFIPCLQPFGFEGERLPFTLDAKQWGTFLCELFDLWYEDFKKGNLIHIRQFENYIEMLLGYPPETCGMSGVCSCQNVIEADGSCYPCDFYVLDKFRLGNLNENNFDEIHKKRTEIKFIENSFKFNQKCLKCKHSSICRGGCKRYCEPFNEENQRSLNLLCDGYYMFFEHSYNKLVGLSKQLSNR